MKLTSLLIRTLIYIVKMLSVIRGAGMIDSEASGLMREWEAELDKERK